MAESRQLEEIARLKNALDDAEAGNRKQAVIKFREYTTSKHVSVIEAIITVLRQSFRYLPDVQEDIIDIAYDLTEDDALQIRLLGYHFVCDLSRLAPSWARRNVDILVQLLAQDEPDDLRAITASIRDHMEIDAMATFQVLCQYGCSAESDDLRGTVLSFLAQDSTKSTYLEDTASAAALSYREGLLSAVMADHVGPMDSTNIVEQLLLPFPLPDEFVNDLVIKVIDKANAVNAREALSNPEKPLSESSLAYLTLAHNIQQQKKSILSLPFLGFYSQLHVLSAITRLEKSAQEDIVAKLAVCLRQVHGNQVLVESEEYRSSRDAITTHSSTWSQVIIASGNKLWSAALPLATTVLHRSRAEASWKPDCVSIATLRAAIPPKPAANRATWQQNLNLVLKEILERADHDLTSDVKMIVPTKSSADPHSQSSRRKRKVSDGATSQTHLPLLTSTAPPRLFGLPAKPPIEEHAPKANLLQRMAAGSTSYMQPINLTRGTAIPNFQRSNLLPNPPSEEDNQPLFKRQRKGKAIQDDPPSLLSRIRDARDLVQEPKAHISNKVALKMPNPSESNPRRPSASAAAPKLSSRPSGTGSVSVPNASVHTMRPQTPKFTPLDQMNKSKSISIKGLSGTKIDGLAAGIKSS